MESSLRAFMLLMLLLAAGVAGVSSSTRSTETRSAQHAAPVTLHVASGQEQHFVFTTRLQQPAISVATDSPPTAPGQTLPRPVQVQPSAAFSICTQDGGWVVSASDLLGNKTSIAAEMAEEDVRIADVNTGSAKAEIAENEGYNAQVATDGTKTSCPGGLGPRAAMGVACGCDPLSSDFVSTWEIDPDQSQVALVFSLCGLRTGLSRPHAQSDLDSLPTRSRAAGNVPGGRPATRRWLSGLRVTWWQFYNWFLCKHLRPEIVDNRSDDPTADCVTLTPDEYAQLMQAIVARVPVASDPPSGADLADHQNR